MEGQVRRLRFDWSDDFDPDWTPRTPELACVANAVSLLMPHAEPYVVDAVRASLDDLDEPLRSEAQLWVAQETAHHGAHLRFNRALIAQRPLLASVDRQMAKAFAWLRRRRSTRSALAYAAAFETLAFIAARWVDRRSGQLFKGAHVEPTTLFLWHLAEEVEHKTVAFDVHRAMGGTRRSLAVGMLTATLLMAWFTVLGTLIGLHGARRLWNPVAHGRMLVWSIAFLFDLLPALAGALFAGHHPSRMADPIWLPTWLESYDPETRTMPEWSMDVTAV